MQKFNYIFFIFACLLSVAVMLVSLQSANRRYLNSGSQDKLLTSKLYVAREILPDHTLYPALMAVDRMRLELAEPAQRSSLMVAYANRRLFYTKRLLEKDQHELAFITLSKAIKYYNDALILSINSFDKNLLSDQENSQIAFMVADSVFELFVFVGKHKDKFSNEERGVLDLLLEQTKIPLLELQEILQDKSLN